MIFSENRYTLFWIMLEPARRRLTNLMPESEGAD
jgi:hypothetical protein